MTTFIDKHYNAVTKTMLGIMLVCVLSITANVGATIKEMEIKQQYAIRDCAIMTQVALLRVDPSISITAMEILKDADRIAGIKN